MKKWKNHLTVALILAVISILLLPSLMNFSLPHVQTQRLKERKVVRTVLIHAQVKPLDIVRFTFDQPVVVAEYFVKKGRSVGRNIPLFRVSMDAGLPQGVNEQAIQWQGRKLEIELALDKLEGDARGHHRLMVQLAEDLSRAEADLSEAERLYDLGVVSKNEMDRAGEAVEAIRLERDVEYETWALKEAGVESERAAYERELAAIEKELAIVGVLVSDFYLDEAGNAYSQASGFILNKNAENERIQAGVPVLEMAAIDDYRRLEMIGHVSVDDLDVVEVGMPLSIDTDTDHRPFHLEITDISHVVENGMVEVAMRMTEEPEGKFAIGTSYAGRVERVLSVDNAYSVPYSAVVEETFAVDDRVTIYRMDQENGLLFDRYYARELRAKVKAIGDREVLVQIDEEDLDLSVLEIVVDPSYGIEKDARVLP